MTEIKSASDEEIAYSAKGNSDGNNGGLPQQGQAPQAAPKPYMNFAAGQVHLPAAFWFPAAKSILSIFVSKYTKKIK